MDLGFTGTWLLVLVGLTLIGEGVKWVIGKIGVQEEEKKDGE